ncbi:YdeI/OmpD-associated family protein [Tenacibaculum aquimarinum]|uniref:YdeI/OmpD-associated family protein n=1 Tax=Tenacibaculum aquimarinum TaxID=2910675 RepID=UPI001F0B4E2B|nr:YdeI/OmpD-associated family protein [Tenacibaculum aquimarinum]MCH3882258.1 YdeI/OmpD-associated family protein [Tenacibaculum aquimarinum]
MFFQGGLLKDKFKVLRNAQEGKTQAMRQMRLETAADIKEDIIKLYVLEAIDNIEAGKEIKPNRTTKPLLIPELLKEVFSKNKDIKIAFNEFTKSKQRDFADHISGAKREATKLSRLEKIIPMILRGEGLHDKYKNC